MRFDKYQDITTLANDDIFMVGQLQEDGTFKFKNISVLNTFNIINSDISALQAEIDAEEINRAAADTTLQGNINDEQVARIAADTLLQPLSEKGQANGYAPLNGVAKIDALYLPSYVDDVLEYANLAAFPATGETGVIYIALDTNKTYRWSGSTYVEISPSEVNSVNARTGHVTGLAEIALPNTFTADNTFNAGITQNITLTSSLVGIVSNQIWNNVSNAFTGLLLDVTDSASSSASLLIDARAGGSSKFLVNKLGELACYGANIAGNASVSGDFTVSSVLFADNTNDILFVGGVGTTGLTNPALVVNKSHTTASQNARGVSVESTVNASGGSVAFANFDAYAQLAGAFNYDHIAGFQARPRFRSTGTLNAYYGFNSVPDGGVGMGTISNVYGFYATNPVDGAITNNYGLYIENQTRGTNNWAVFTAGTTASSFGGVVFVGNATAGGHALNRTTADARYFQQASTIPIANGGTGQTTAVAAFDALSPLTTLGDLLYNNGTNDVRLAGNTTATKQFLSQTGNGSVSAAPVWGALVAGDIPDLSATYIKNQTSQQASSNFNISGTGVVGTLLAGTVSLGSQLLQVGGNALVKTAIAGDLSLEVNNTNTGTSAAALLKAVSDGGQLSITMFGMSHSSFPDRARVMAESNVSNGLDLGTNGNADVRIIRNGSGAATFTSAGLSLPGTLGVTGISTFTGRADHAGGITVGGGATMTKFLSGSATIDFPSTAAQTSSTSDVTVTGAAIGDPVILGLDSSVIPGDTENVRWEAWVNAPNTVRIRVKNMMAVAAFNPPSAVFTVDVIKTT